MAFITSSKIQPAYDVIVVGSGAAGGQNANVLAMARAKVLMPEAGRNYDPVSETPMLNTHILRQVAQSVPGRVLYDARRNCRHSVSRERATVPI